MASISVLRGGDRGYTRPTQTGENQDCLRRLTPPRPPAQVNANLPVKHLIGWLYYGAAFQWGNKRAVRTGRTTRIDFMWRYSLIMYSLTNKNIYKFGTLQNIKGREDVVPMVRTAIEQYGTLSESGRPCSGIELDFAREHVSTLVPSLVRIE